MGVTHSISVTFSDNRVITECDREEEFRQIETKNYPEIPFDAIETSPLVTILNKYESERKKQQDAASKYYFTTVIHGEEDLAIYEMTVNKQSVNNIKENGGGTSVLVYKSPAKVKNWRQPFCISIFKQGGGKMDKVTVPAKKETTESIYDDGELVTVDCKTGSFDELDRVAKYSYQFGSQLTLVKTIRFYLVPSGVQFITGYSGDSSESGDSKSTNAKELEFKRRENALTDREIEIKELEKQLKEKDEILKEKEKVLKEREKSLQEREFELKNQQSVISKQALEIASAVGELKQHLKSKSAGFVQGTKKSKQVFEDIGRDAGAMGKEILDRVAPGQKNVYIHCKSCGEFCMFRRTNPSDGVQWLFPKSAKPQEISNYIAGYTPADTGTKVWFEFEKNNLPAAEFDD